MVHQFVTQDCPMFKQLIDSCPYSKKKLCRSHYLVISPFFIVVKKRGGGGL